MTGSHGGRTVTVVFAKPFADWRILFDHMVPAHIARKVGWNTGFATFDPAVDLSAGPLLVASVSGGTAHLVRNPSWWGTKSVLGSVTVSDDQADAGWIGPLATTATAVSQPGRFSLASLSSVSALPNAQSSIHPALTFLSLEFNVKSAGRVPRGRPAGRGPRHRPGRTLLNRLFGTIDPTLAVNQDHLSVAWQTSYSASTAAGEYAQVDLSGTDSLLKSLGYSDTPGTPYVDAAGKPFTVRMAVEEGDPWIDEAATGIAAQLRAAGITVVVLPVQGADGLASAAAANAYDMALVTRTSGPYQSITHGWYSDGTGRWGANDDQNWSRFDDPQVERLFVQAAQELNPVTGRRHLHADRRPAVGPDGGAAAVRRARPGGQRGPGGQCGLQPVGGRHPVERGPVDPAPAGAHRRPLLSRSEPGGRHGGPLSGALPCPSPRWHHRSHSSEWRNRQTR